MPAAVLLLTLGVAAAAIFEARRAAVTTHDSTRALVHGHSAVAAWSFAERIRERGATDPATLREIFANTALLPNTLSNGRPNSELVFVQLRDARDSVVFATPGESWGAEVTEPLGPRFNNMKVVASVLFPAARALMPDNRAADRLPVLVWLLGLAFVTATLAIVLMRREAHLARVRSDFVSSVSHELRTPLAQIRLFFETLRLGRYKSDEQREWILDNIERESFRLSTLIDNILMFSRTERGARGGIREPVEIKPYLEGLAKEFAPLAATRQVNLQLEVPADLFASLHAESFRQVLLNLLDNAIKYGPIGQTVRVSAEQADNRVRITIEDEGAGVAPRERKAIFQAFYRGSDALETVATGSGIGLAVVREITEWHGGTVAVEDGSTGGARFVVEIPRVSNGANTTR